MVAAVALHSSSIDNKRLIDNNGLVWTEYAIARCKRLAIGPVGVSTVGCIDYSIHQNCFQHDVLLFMLSV